MDIQQEKMEREYSLGDHPAPRGISWGFCSDNPRCSEREYILIKKE